MTAAGDYQTRNSGERMTTAGRRCLAVVTVLCSFLTAISTYAAEILPDWVAFSGSLELAYERQQNLDLDKTSADDADLLPAELQLGVRLRPNAFFEAYVETQLSRQFVLHEEGENENRRTELQLKEAYVRLTEPDWGLSLQVGRQLFQDDREWLYDAELDALRGRYEKDGFTLELSASRSALIDQDLFNEADLESVDSYIVHTSYDVNQAVRLGAYGILSDHRNDNRDRPLFLGAFANGSVGGHIDYWADAALVRGRAEGRKLRGVGFDLFAVYHVPAPLSPYVILGYAFGSGDDNADDGRDGAFRQTGLQGNEINVGGRTSFRFYGEAFDPELSNMSIFTAGFGLLPHGDLSLDLVGHYYLQDQASDSLGETGLTAEPTGGSRHLGSEVDVILGFEPLENLELQSTLGLFLPGAAFGSGTDPALFARIEARYEF